MGSAGREYIPGRIHRSDRMASTGLYEDGKRGIRRITDPDLRLKDQDRDGVQAEVLYGVLGTTGRMNDPEAAGDEDYYPTRYTGTADYGGVHSNSGIANLAFYLMVMGGTHPLGKTTVSVPALSSTASTSINMGARIWYRALTVYMNSSTNFEGARNATAQAATVRVVRRRKRGKGSRVSGERAARGDGAWTFPHPLRARPLFAAGEPIKPGRGETDFWHSDCQPEARAGKPRSVTSDCQREEAI